MSSPATSKTERLIDQSGSYAPVSPDGWSDSPSLSQPPQQQIVQQFMMPQYRDYARILHWQTALKILHLALGMLTILYCIDTWNASESCYVTPCYLGPGLATVWKVNTGISVVGFSSGLFMLIHSLLGSYLFASNIIQDDCVNMYYRAGLLGTFVGFSICASLLSLNMSFLWAAEWNLLSNLTKLDEYNKIFSESGRHMEVNISLVYTFRRLFYLSASIFVAHLLVLVEMAVGRRAVLEQFKLGGGSVSNASYNEMNQLQTHSPASVTSPEISNL